jgi:hypothetical protein
MIFNHKRISGTAVQTLSAAVASSVNVNTIERLLICNTDTTDIVVTVYLDNGSGGVYNLLYNSTIPVGTSLDVLHGIPFQYEESYAVKLELDDAAYTADVIFNQQ